MKISNSKKELAHAINSHDELVAEVERLRADNERLRKLNQQASYRIDILSNAEHGKIYGFNK